MLLIIAGLALAPTKLQGQELPPEDPPFPIPLGHDRLQRPDTETATGQSRSPATEIAPIATQARGRVLARFIHVGMTPEQVQQVLGNPICQVGNFTGDAWFYVDWELWVAFVRDASGAREHVHQVDAGQPAMDDRLRAAEKRWEGLWCLWYTKLSPPLSVAAPSWESIEQSIEIERLILQMGNSDFKKAENASSRLAAMGDAAIDALEQASENSSNTEVRRRAEALLFHSGEPLLTLRGHDAPICALAFSQDGKRLAVGFADGLVNIWDATSGQRQLYFRAHDSVMLGLALSADSRLLATGGADRTARTWDTATGHQLACFQAEAIVHGVAFSPDSRQLVTADEQHRNVVWDIVTGKQVDSSAGVYDLPAKEQYNRRNTLRKTDDRALLNTGTPFLTAVCKAHTVTVWDATRQRRWLTVPICEDGEVALSPKGDHLAVVSPGGWVEIWHLVRPKGRRTGD